MAALAAFILATAAATAEAPRPAPPPHSVATSASASVTVVRAERVSVSDQPAAMARNVRREAGKIAIDFY